MSHADDHRRYHEGRYLIAAALIAFDLVAAAVAVHVFDAARGALIFLLPALPVTAVAVTDWIASGIRPSQCTCKFRLF